MGLMLLFAIVLLKGVAGIGASDSRLAAPIERFIDDAFRGPLRTMHLVGMAHLAEFDTYLSLPYPKVVQERLTGMPLESTLVVMFVDVSSAAAMYSCVPHLFNRPDHNHPPDGKYLLVGDDYELHRSGPDITYVLKHLMQHLGVIFWCVTGRLGGSMQYRLAMAAAESYHQSPLDAALAFGMERFAPIKRVRIRSQMLVSFPYTIWIHVEGRRGIDYDIFKDIIDHLQLVPSFDRLTDHDARELMRQLAENLFHMSVDFMATRRFVDHAYFPSVPIPEATFYCIVAPRAVDPDFTKALLKPFSDGVWLAIGGWLACGSIMSALSRPGRRLDGLMRRVPGRQFVAHTYSTLLNVVRFVLIECYLAKITSFFIVYQFPGDAVTLEEFFATGIPIRLEDDQEEFLNGLDASVAQAIRQRAIGATECDEFSERCAHLDSYARATNMINHWLSNHPVSGRTMSYVVKEMLYGTQMSYVFARGSSVKPLFEVYLRRMYESGLVSLYNRQYDQYIDNVRKHVFVDETIQFAHLISLWIFVSVGWSVSAVVFALEMVMRYVSKLCEEGKHRYAAWWKQCAGEIEN